MRILYASERPPYPFFLGGAARCAHEIMRTLVCNTTTECMAVGSSDFSNPPWSFPETEDYKTLGILNTKNNSFGGEIDCGYPVKVIADFPQNLGHFIDQYRPDVVWAQMEGAPMAIETAYKKGIHCLLFIHDAEFNVKELQITNKMVNGIVCSSQFLARKIQSAIRRKSQVVYPCPKIDFNANGNSDGYLTLINSHRVKGLETFLKIAEHMPQQCFLLVESWKLTDEALKKLNERLKTLPNIKFMRRVSDMRKIYQQTKLLLVPSVWEEGFGMVAIEAQSCRIPVIASARGGLPESVGDGGVLIDDYQNPTLWVKEIEKLIDDKNAYETLAQRAYQHAHQELFAIPESANRFLAFCAKLQSHPIKQSPVNSFFTHLSKLARRPNTSS